MVRARKRRQGGSPTMRATVGTVTGPSRARLANPAAPGFTPARPPNTNRSFAPTMAPTHRAVTRPTASYAPAPVVQPQAVAPPQTASSTAMRANAQQALQGAEGNYRDSVYRAIMNLGDPTQFAKYQADPMFAGYSFTQDPNSLFAQLQRQQDQGLQDLDVNANAGNTFFSGKRLLDRQNLIDDANRQRGAGTTDFLDNLRTIGGALTGAQGDYRQAVADADQADIDAALQAARDNRAALGGVGPAKGVMRPGVAAPQPTHAQQQQAAAAFARAQAQARVAEAQALARVKKKAKTKRR